MSPSKQNLLRLVPSLTLLVLLGPVVAGLAGTLAPAFGFLPVIGKVEPGLEAFSALMHWPGLSQAMWLSVFTGIMATVLSLAITTLFVACWSGTRAFSVFLRLLSPLLSVPHAAAAFGLAFLIAPSGWIVRGVSPWATGWAQPPDLLIVQDPLGLSLIAGLVVKEVPFLLLMMLAALGQTQASRAQMVARSLGYDRPAAWLKVVFPKVYAQVRLPVLVVLAFSMTVVDVAMILGPNTPPTLAVQILHWMSAPDLTERLMAAAAAVLQLALVLAVLGFWFLAERWVAWLGHRWVWSGRRHAGGGVTGALSLSVAVVAAVTVLAGLAGLLIWSFAGLWSFPDVFPNSLTMRSWMRHLPGVLHAVGHTVIIALSATLIALALTVGCLEAEHRYGLRMRARGQWLLYLPLLMPQVAFLPGVQTAMLMLGLTGDTIAVIMVHVLFVFPYVFLSLGDPFRAWDTRFATVAHSLHATPARVLWMVRLPMLLAPVLTAFAVGMAVSVGQYLPTLLISGGRVQTITTEAVALASGGDRRAIGVWALVQTGLALLPFALAVALPRLVWCNRKGVLNDQ